MMMELSGIVAGYGGLRALDGVAVGVEEGEWLAVLGAVGAGKTTLLGTMAGLLEATAGDIVFRGRSIARVVSGALRPQSGSVHFAGRDITGWAPPPDRRARSGADVSDRAAVHRIDGAGVRHARGIVR